MDGYYRVAHSESDQLLAFATGGHRLHRVPTRMTGFSVSPARPARNAKLTASGTLSAHPGSSWRALGKARVGLVFKPSGDSPGT